MKKIILMAAIAAALPSAASAQTALNAYSLSQGDLRGSARFMSMGGAFTALGGDISTLHQNPAGIGIYRSSDVTATLDISLENSNSGSDKWNNTWVNCNNFGYIGAINLGSQSAMPFFNWGFSYSRVASFNRRFRGTLDNIGTSLTNFVADYTTADGYSPAELDGFTNGYNPYYGSSAPWMSILMFNTYGINPVDAGAGSYSGLWNYGKSSGSAEFEIEEKGHVDEYDINFGGNIQNVIFWGVGIGITDIDYKQNAYYGEAIDKAIVPSADAKSTVEGSASYGLTNWTHAYGTGVNFKFGLIAKPINEFRLGFAIHTPTYYNMTYEGGAAAGYTYKSPTYPTGTMITSDGLRDYSNYTDYGYLDSFDWKLRTPWRMMVGAAGVLYNSCIISAEYEYRPYQSMLVKNSNNQAYNDVTDDIKTYYQATNIFRVGAEYKFSSAFSIRAGYSYESSPVRTATMAGENTFYTSGPADTQTQPSITLDRSTQYATCGLGYRYKHFYADLAYVQRYRRSKYQAFTNYIENVPGADGTTGYVTAPSARITQKNSSIVMTIGFRF